MTYRAIPPGDGACRTCDTIVRVRGGVTAVHGPKTARCLGSGRPPRPWLEASGLPGWDELTDRDKGCAIVHVWKRDHLGDKAALKDWPARYTDHPVLVRVSRENASRHAYYIAGTWEQAKARLGGAEMERLYVLARDAQREKAAA